MNTNKILTSVFISLLLVVAVFFYILKGNKSGAASQKIPTASSDVLFLTTPATSFTGTIEKIEGDTLTVTQKASLSQYMPVTQTNGKVPVIPTPIQKTITLKVQVDKNTSFTKNTSLVPYLFKNTGTGAPSAPEKITVTDLKAGQNVSVMTDTDLRFVLEKTPKALSVSLSPITNMVSGKISAINGQSLTVVSSTPPLTSSQKPKETTYTVTVTSDTEISRYVYSTNASTDPSKASPPTPVRVSLSELKKDMFVTVYADTDTTTEKNITALRIEPQVFTPEVTASTPVGGTSPVTASPAAK